MKPHHPHAAVLRRATRRPHAKSAWEAAKAYGCDMSLIEENLRKTPAERVMAHRRALQTLTILREAKLLQAKQAMDRPRDKESVRQLQAIKERKANKR